MNPRRRGGDPRLARGQPGSLPASSAASVDQAQRQGAAGHQTNRPRRHQPCPAHAVIVPLSGEQGHQREREIGEPGRSDMRPVVLGVAQRKGGEGGHRRGVRRRRGSGRSAENVDPGGEASHPDRVGEKRGRHGPAARSAPRRQTADRLPNRRIPLRSDSQQGPGGDKGGRATHTAERRESLARPQAAPRCG